MAASEDHEAMGGRQLAIEPAHFQMVEVIRAGRGEQRKRQRFSNAAIRISGARGDHAGDVLRRQGDAERHTGAAGHAGEIHALGIDREALRNVVGHRGKNSGDLG